MDLIVMDFIEAMQAKIRQDMNNFTDDLATGACPDHAAYKELCGVIRGLAYAERHLLDLVENIEKANDE